MVSMMSDGVTLFVFGLFTRQVSSERGGSSSNGSRNTKYPSPVFKLATVHINGFAVQEVVICESTSCDEATSRPGAL